VTDFLDESEIRSLIKRANMHDELGETAQAEEIDALIASLLERVDIQKQAEDEMTDILAMQSDAKQIHALLSALIDAKEALLASQADQKLERWLQAPNLDPKMKQYLEVLLAQVKAKV
jgi:hypothetical protein